ncbi:MAG: hypothetical protein ACR2N4_06000 [Jatrophihabitans sp.]
MPQHAIRVLRSNHALVIGTALHMFRCGLRDIGRDRTPKLVVRRRGNATVIAPRPPEDAAPRDLWLVDQ